MSSLAKCYEEFTGQNVKDFVLSKRFLIAVQRPQQLECLAMMALLAQPASRLRHLLVEKPSESAVRQPAPVH